MQRRSWLVPEGLMVLVVLIWGVNFSVVKALMVYFHPHTLNALRLIIAAGVLGVLYYTEQRRKHQRFFAPLRTHGWALAGLGLLGFALYQALFIVGVDATTTGNAALIMASVPLWVALFSMTFKVETVTRRMWFGITLSLMGTGLVIISGSDRFAFGSGTWEGNAIILVAACSWSLFTALNKKLLTSITPIALTFWGLMISLPVLCALAVPFADPTSWTDIPGWSWLAVVYSGALSSGMAIVWWNTSVERSGPSRTAAFGNTVPFITLVVSFFWLGEPITLAHLMGGGLIIGGIAVMRKA